MKKINPIITVLGSLIILGATFLLFRALTAERAFNAFADTVQIRRGDIAYESVKRPLFGNGFILYQARIPALSVPHRIDKVIIHPVEKGIRIRLLDVRVPVIDSLRQVYGDEIIPAMQAYRPYHDLLRHPLISLGVMDVNEARFDLTLTVNPSLTQQTVQGKLKLKGLVDASFDAVIAHPSDGSKNPVFALYGDLTQLHVVLAEQGGLRRYRKYVESTGMLLPIGVAQMSHEKQTEKLSFTFNPVVSLTPVYQRKPH